MKNITLAVDERVLAKVRRAMRHPHAVPLGRLDALPDEPVAGARLDCDRA